MKLPLTLITILLLSLLLSFTATESSEDRLFKIAAEYKSYIQEMSSTMVIVDTAKYNWTVFMCRQLSDAERGIYYKHESLFISKPTTTESPHGNKLYKLFVNDWRRYEKGYLKEQPIGQVLVKETWNVEEVNKNQTSAVQSRNDGKWYAPTTVSQLFIMYKEEPSPNNDKGWVYGIVDVEKGPSSANVLENGNLSNCISCHKDTKYDRIFGPVSDR